MARPDVRQSIAQLVERRQRCVAGASIEYEAELRLGVCADARGVRVRDADTPIAQFASNIGEAHFYATFERLYERADVVSDAQLSTVSHYAAEATGGNRGVRAELDRTGGREREHWTAKRQMERKDYPFQAWFDVRLTLNEECRVDAPPAVLEARQLASRIKNPWQQPRTRLGVAVHTRRRTRRSMQFRDALAWRIDFTRVETSALVRGQSDFAGGGEQYRLETARNDVHEIEIEYVSTTHSPTPAEATAQAMRLLARLATALGCTAKEVRRRMQSDRHAAEMRTMAAIQY